MSTFRDYLAEKGYSVGPLPALWLKRHVRDPQSPAAVDDMLALGLRTADGKPLPEHEQRRVKSESNDWPLSYLTEAMAQITRLSGLEDDTPGP